GPTTAVALRAFVSTGPTSGPEGEAVDTRSRRSRRLLLFGAPVMGAHRLYDYPSPDEVRRLVDELGIKGTARHLGIPYSTFYGHWEKVRDGKLPGEHSSPVRDV